MGQCGVRGTCNVDTRVCDCEEGVSGNQCSECVSNAGCNNGGTCLEGVCTCNDGLKGTFCSQSEKTSDATRHDIMTIVAFVSVSFGMLLV